MIVRTTTQITLQYTYGRTATYIGNDRWDGDVDLIKLLSIHKETDLTRYLNDPVYNFGEFLCKEFPELTIKSTKYFEEEYPDNTVF